MMNQGELSADFNQMLTLKWLEQQPFSTWKAFHVLVTQMVSGTSQTYPRYRDWGGRGSC